MVIAFRGTASMKNVLHDLRVDFSLQMDSLLARGVKTIPGMD